LSDAPIFFAIEAKRPGSILRINRRFARFVLKLRRSDCLYASSCGAHSGGGFAPAAGVAELFFARKGAFPQLRKRAAEVSDEKMANTRLSEN
ncbi:MAG: hypothetical protein KBT08_09590, partial [Bacteroidales bacterium]|nr:hypothetical protein [Candidatus Cryptobacteroides onthequi]